MPAEEYVNVRVARGIFKDESIASISSRLQSMTFEQAIASIDDIDAEIGNTRELTYIDPFGVSTGDIVIVPFGTIYRVGVVTSKADAHDIQPFIKYKQIASVVGFCE